jgi:hypothetical protein
MLPTRKSSPAPRRSHVVAAEVRIPSTGIAFGALAGTIRPESLFLTTFQDIAVGTIVMVELSLPDGPAIVDGVVVHAGDSAGLGIAIELEAVDDAMRMRLSAASSMIPPAMTRVA